MSDNRMWLAHKPTGIAIMLGKEYDYDLQWFQAPTAERLDRYYRVVAKQIEYSNPEDFVLLFETNSSWYYTEKWVEDFHVLALLGGEPK